MNETQTVGMKPNGPAVAAIMAAGLGSLVIGVCIVLAERSDAIKNALNWWNPAGPLTGKTGVGVIVWLVAWIGLHATLKRKDLSFSRLWAVGLALIIGAWLLTFPPVFDLLAGK